MRQIRTPAGTTFDITPREARVAAALLRVVFPMAAERDGRAPDPLPVLTRSGDGALEVTIGGRTLFVIGGGEVREYDRDGYVRWPHTSDERRRLHAIDHGLHTDLVREEHDHA